MNETEVNEMLELIRNKFHQWYNSSGIVHQKEDAQNLARDLNAICIDYRIELE
jgi:hypothetical protein